VLLLFRAPGVYRHSIWYTTVLCREEARQVLVLQSSVKLGRGKGF